MSNTQQDRNLVAWDELPYFYAEHVAEGVTMGQVVDVFKTFPSPVSRAQFTAACKAKGLLKEEKKPSDAELNEFGEDDFPFDSNVLDPDNRIS
jgi:hypothetical protein